VGEKQPVTYKGTPIKLLADISAETLQARREWQNIFTVLKVKKTSSQEYSAWKGYHSKLKER